MITRFDSIGSTHDQAKILVNPWRDTRLTIIAQKQTHGRGRGDKKWWAPEGMGLYVSFLRTIPDIEHDLITTLMGMKISYVLRQHTLLDIQQRGVNDIFLDNRKLGGILCEIYNGALIVSVGINLFRPSKVVKHLEKSAVWLNEFSAEDRISQDIILKLLEDVI